GAIITASHNPPQWNGIKMTRDRAIPIIKDEIQKRLVEIIETERYLPVQSSEGTLTSRDIQSDYVAQVLKFNSFAPGARRLKVVIDPGNGTTIRFLPEIMKQLPVDWEWINEQPDGNFPGRNPNPLADGALDGLSKKVIDAGADVGVAFDADADRMFFVDETGRRVSGDVLTALLAKEFLQLHPGSNIVYNLICSHMVPEEIVKAGGTPVRSPVGHAFIKPIMREHNAVFGGEISGHFFFRDHYFVDSGLVAMVVGLSYLANQAMPLSALVKAIDIYAHTAEVNTKVDDIPATLAKIKARYADGKIDEEDGVTVEYDDWWFNVRPSNTEPLLRLSVEARTTPAMEAKREELLKIIRG
ncbi:MAG: phosphomannomutase/phosphoglucomutase, partial [Candidatus Kerfeldbacteria bacterium]|nr:phosphomannomutase/phosphoglucomutase [Candidatus Kerfeldbacteria bacterium]